MREVCNRRLPLQDPLPLPAGVCEVHLHTSKAVKVGIAFHLPAQQLLTSRCIAHIVYSVEFRECYSIVELDAPQHVQRGNATIERGSELKELSRNMEGT
jgi:hypothetical protein